ncbi:MAG: hypothetical protein KDK24_18705 [Pseudooceanicola sp.]|nr:hypothetical protein [Pseudooceanicola sp.]
MSTTDDLSKVLKDRYETAQDREQVTQIHLFGIEFADVLEGHAINDIAELATGHRSYGTEIRKGIRLAKYVSLKS